jgi:hypothetical protein
MSYLSEAIKISIGIFTGFLLSWKFPVVSIPMEFLGLTTVSLVIVFYSRIKRYSSYFDKSKIHELMEEKVSVVKKGKSLIVKLNGKTLIVPYDRTLVKSQMANKFYFVEQDDTLTEFIPYPGVPILVVPSDMGYKDVAVSPCSTIRRVSSQS